MRHFAQFDDAMRETTAGARFTQQRTNRFFPHIALFSTSVLSQTEPFHTTVLLVCYWFKGWHQTCWNWHLILSTSWMALVVFVATLMLGRTQLRWFMRYRSKVCVRAFDTCKARAASSSLLIKRVACNMMTSLVWNHLSCNESTRWDCLVPVLLRRTPSREGRRSREDQTGNTTQNRD